MSVDRNIFLLLLLFRSRFRMLFYYYYYYYYYYYFVCWIYAFCYFAVIVLLAVAIYSSSCTSAIQRRNNGPCDSLSYTYFLVIFRNEITTILSPSTSEGVSGGGHVFCFEGPWLRIRNVNIHTYIYIYIYIYIVTPGPF